MKLKILNIISGVFFVLSSACILSIPFLNIESGFTVITYILAGLFWGGLIIGFLLQIILAGMSRGLPVIRNKKIICRTIGIAFLVFLIALIPIIMFFNGNNFILPINLFALLLSAESYCVIKQMERVK